MLMQRWSFVVVLELDKSGNDLADGAADCGRRKVSDLVSDVRRRFVSAYSVW